MKNAFLLFACMVMVSSCATHSTMRGSVAMKVSDNEAHVCLGKGEVKEGDIVTAFYNDCSNVTGGGADKGAGAALCEKTKLGSGKVTKVLNDHYSVIKFDEGVKFSEGTFVEKQ